MIQHRTLDGLVTRATTSSGSAKTAAPAELTLLLRQGRSGNSFVLEHLADILRALKHEWLKSHNQLKL
jgi:hypothetical protein